MTTTEIALLLGNKKGLPAKDPLGQIGRKRKGIRSLSPSRSGLDVNQPLPCPMAVSSNSINQGKFEKPTPSQPTPPPEQPINQSMSAERQAKVVQLAITPAALATALGMESQIGAAGYRVFLDELIRDSGNPSDPVEIMLLEQMVMCHLRSMQMQIQASQAQGTEAIECYMSAGGRLCAEFRKTALAFKEYRRK